MHAIFFLYGHREGVERALRDMESQNMLIEFKKGDELKKMVIRPHLRQLPFGAYEIIFPESVKDTILTSLLFHVPAYMGTAKRWKIKPLLTFARKLYQAEKIPSFDTTNKYAWMIGAEHSVHVVPIGVRYDTLITDPTGWTHEAL